MYKEAKFKMSEERLNQLKEELTYLQTVREKEVAQQIKEARSFGDLTENSEYDEAKTEQGKLYSKIAELKNLIENAEIVQFTKKTDYVGLGSSVTIREVSGDGSDDAEPGEGIKDKKGKPEKAAGDDQTYKVVGSQEADPLEGLISDDSPIGKALMDKKKGDVVSFEAPDGVRRFKIINID